MPFAALGVFYGQRAHGDVFPGRGAFHRGQRVGKGQFLPLVQSNMGGAHRHRKNRVVAHHQNIVLLQVLHPQQGGQHFGNTGRRFLNMHIFLPKHLAAVCIH